MTTPRELPTKDMWIAAQNAFLNVLRTSVENCEENRKDCIDVHIHAALNALPIAAVQVLYDGTVWFVEAARQRLAGYGRVAGAGPADNERERV